MINKINTLDNNPTQIMCTVCGGTGKCSDVECIICNGIGSIDASLFSCKNCKLVDMCPYSYDLYNMNGRCLVEDKEN